MLIMYTSKSFLRQGESLASLPTISTHCVYGCLLAAAGMLPKKFIPELLLRVLLDLLLLLVF